MSDPLVLRPLHTTSEYRAAQEIQRRAWGITADGYLMPVSLMISVQHAGGLVLGAFQGERLVGFSLGYLGRVRGRMALYSQLTAVDPLLQASGIGGELKRWQRAWAARQGLELLAWCFDPLQAGNAHFNLQRLRATARTYLVNHYGERHDALNHSLPTDRLLVEWSTEDAPARWQGAAEPTAVLDGVPSGDALHPRLHGVRMSPDLTLRIGVPADIGALKTGDLPLAQAWQQALRTAMQEAFAAGFVAMAFHRHPASLPWYELRMPVTGEH